MNRTYDNLSVVRLACGGDGAPCFKIAKKQLERKFEWTYVYKKASYNKYRESDNYLSYSG